jgi:hypothetical protein
MNGSTNADNKVRVKMQVIESGTEWQNAEISIIDHLSAFFVSNQKANETEKFDSMSTEMK